MPTNREEASEIFKRLSLIEATLARIDERTASFIEDKKAVCACIEDHTSRIAAIRAMREAAGWVAKPPRERPPKVHVYSVMKCVQAAQQMGLWESAIKPFLITNNLIELVYTAQDFRSDNPNFKTAIQALTGMGIDQATIDAALKTAEIEGGK